MKIKPATTYKRRNKKIIIKMAIFMGSKQTVFNFSKYGWMYESIENVYGLFFFYMNIN